MYTSPAPSWLRSALATTFALGLIASLHATTTFTVVNSAAPIGASNQTITVTVVRDDGALNLAQFRLNFPDAVLSINSVSLANGGSNSILAQNSLGPGIHFVNFADFAGSGAPAGQVVSVNFDVDVKGDASAGVYDLTVTNEGGPATETNFVVNNGDFTALSFGISHSATSTVNGSSRIVTSEPDGTGSFDVVLNTQPSADVVVTLSDDNPAEGTASPTTLTFTTSDWDQAQPVTVTGQDDAIDDGDIDYSVSFSASSSDTDYDSAQNALLAAAPVLLTNNDDDSAGVTVAVTDGTTDESGATGTFTVVLDSEPIDTVTVNFASSDATEGQVTSTNPLTFDAGDWDQPKTVTVTGQNDDIDENGANTAYSIDLTVTSGGDDNYDGISAASANLTNADNDGDTTGVTVTVTDASTQEVGSPSDLIGTFTVVLTSEPTDDVTIDLASDTPAEGLVTDPAGKQLTFTAGDWDQVQTVTVTGQDELVDDDDASYSVGLTVSSGDGNYDGFSASSAGFTNLDDDEAGLVITSKNSDSEEDGTAATFVARLGTEPTADVTVTFVSSDTSEGELDTATFTFTTQDWSTTQTVTVTGQDDADLDGNQSYRLSANLSSNDQVYSGSDYAFIRVDSPINASTIPLNNLDNEANSLAITADGRASIIAGQGTSITVIAKDVNNRLADLNGSVSLTFSGPSASPDGNNPTLDGQNVGTLSLTFSSGVSSHSQLIAFKAESATLNASLSSNTSVNTNSGGGLALDLDVSAATKNDVRFVTLPTGPNTAGVEWASFSAEITDAFGNRTADTDTITVTTSVGNFQTGSTSVPASNGLATFSGLAHQTAGTHNVTVSSGGLNSDVENGIVVNPAAIDHYAIQFAGGAQTAGTAFNISIQAQDVFDNDITSGNDAAEAVSLSTSVTDAGLTPTSVNTSLGGAIASITATVATASQSVTFTGNTSSKSGTTSSFAVNPGPLSHLTFTNQPSSSVAVPGTIATGQDSVVAELRDAFDNLRTSDSSTVLLSLVDANTNGSTAAILSGTTSVAASGGIATFTDLEVDTEGVYKLRANSNEPSGLSAAFAIGDPPPAETASSASISGGSDLTKTFTTDEAAGRVVNISASFDESIDSGRGQVTEGTVASVVWAVDGNTEQTDNNDSATFTSTFDFGVDFDRVSSGDGTHNNTQTFTVTATASDDNGSPTVLTWTITVNDTNRAPSITGVTISVQGGGSVFADSVLVASPQGESDADNDTVTYDYEWLANGNSIALRTGFGDTLSGVFAKDQVISVRATPRNDSRDDNQSGTSQTSAGTTILNSAPVVIDQTGSVDDNATTTIDLSTNVLDVDEDSLAYTISANPAHGSVLLTGSSVTDPTAKYTADWAALSAGDTGTDTFTFQATDNTDQSNHGTVSITVTGVNDAPTAEGQSLNVRANTAGEDPNSIAITLAGDDIDSDDDSNSLDFEILSLPDGTLSSNDAGRAAVSIGTTLTVADFPLTFTPDDDFRGLTEFTFQTIDQHDERSAVTTIKITVGTPPWFRFIALTDYDNTLDADEPQGFYQVEIRDGASNVVLFVQVTNKAAVEPQDYLNAGSAGLLPGNYTITVRKFNGTDFDTLAQDSLFVVDEYEVATAEEGGDPTTQNGNRVFSFDLDFAAGYRLCVTQPDGEILEFIVTFRPDNDGVIPLSGTFTKSVFLPQAGAHSWKIIAFNPKGDSATSTGAEFENTGGGLVDAPGKVVVEQMIPGGWIPIPNSSEPESNARRNPVNAATASTVDGLSVANITLSWPAADGAREYRIFLSTYGREVIINTDTSVDANTTTFGPIALPPGQYFWNVIAINHTGGEWSHSAYFRVASDPNSGLPNIDEISVTADEDGVTFEADNLRKASHVQLEIVKRTDSTHRLSIYVPEIEFNSFLLANDAFATDVNLPNELFVYQSRAVNLPAANHGNVVTGSPTILSHSRWTAVRRYSGHDTLGGIGSINVDQVPITEGWPNITIPDQGDQRVTHFQIQFRVFTPVAPFTFTTPDDHPAPFEPIGAYTVLDDFTTTGVHVHIRVRLSNGDDPNAAGFDAGPWSGWAVHVNPPSQ